MDKHILKNLRQSLKRLFKDYRTITSSLKKNLKKLGFIIVSGRKHYKLFYHKNMHQPFILSKTASDQRSGLNFVSKLLYYLQMLNIV